MTKHGMGMKGLEFRITTFKKKYSKNKIWPNNNNSDEKMVEGTKRAEF